MKNNRIDVRLSNEEKERLFRLAKQKKIKPSELIRRWIRRSESPDMVCELRISPKCTGEADNITDRGYSCLWCGQYRLANMVGNVRKGKQKLTNTQWEIAKAAIAAGDDPHEAIRGK